jgi:hypothetical protein
MGGVGHDGGNGGSMPTDLQLRSPPNSGSKVNRVSRSRPRSPRPRPSSPTRASRNDSKARPEQGQGQRQWERSDGVLDHAKVRLEVDLLVDHARTFVHTYADNPNARPGLASPNGKGRRPTAISTAMDSPVLAMAAPGANSAERSDLRQESVGHEYLKQSCVMRSAFDNCVRRLLVHNPGEAELRRVLAKWLERKLLVTGYELAHWLKSIVDKAATGKGDNWMHSMGDGSGLDYKTTADKSARRSHSRERSRGKGREASHELAPFNRSSSPSRSISRGRRRADSTDAFDLRTATIPVHRLRQAVHQLVDQFKKVPRGSNEISSTERVAMEHPNVVRFIRFVCSGYMDGQNGGAVPFEEVVTRFELAKTVTANERLHESSGELLGMIQEVMDVRSITRLSTALNLDYGDDKAGSRVMARSQAPALAPSTPAETKHAATDMDGALTMMMSELAEGSNLRSFIACFKPLALNDTGGQGKAERKAAWSAADPNGNGYVSLAEFDGWIKQTLLNDKTLSHADADQLWHEFRPCYIRAFKDAADVMTDVRVAGTASATTDDYIQKGEFRVACAYLIVYAAMYDAFSTIDGGGGGVFDNVDHAEAARQLFNVIDRDSDGKLTRAEIIRTIR